MKIWLADLTYTQQSIASDVVPAGIGMIAEYTEKKITNIDKIKLFKFPETLSESLNINTPDLIGFSNYVWNSSLTDIYLKRIKEENPKVITVVGGPNFPTDKDEQKDYLKKRPYIDFYIIKEGEHAFVSLVECLINNGSQEQLMELPNLVFNKNNFFHSSKKIERIMDLSQIPSPYLSNRLDEFLDGKLLPITQTNRGCPFTCTFCTEGQGYWTKVKRKPREVVEGEISYISEKMNKLPKNKRRTDLLIADSNFGMFEEDLETCKVIAKEQNKNNYPKYINVATGKNKKERVLEAAKIVQGAMKLAGSVQSLDPDIQQNIKRKNISSKEIVDMALKSSEIGANTYSEVILGLPGDTKEKHFQTLKTLVESSFTTISMYQLMILPGTELGSKETKVKYKMRTKYRVVPRCYGSYKIFDKESNVAEIEEICTSNNTLSFDDYLECRKMNLIINVFYNDSVFEEIISLIKCLKISIWDWLEEIYENSKLDQFSKFNDLLSDFLNDSENELWSDYSELRKFTEKKENIEKFINGKLGSNLIFKYKSRSLTKDLINIGQIAEKSTLDIIKKNKIQIKEIEIFIKDLINYKKCQIEDIFSLDKQKISNFKFDIPKFIKDNKDMFNISNLDNYKFNKIKKLEFLLSDDQIDQIKSYNSLFGTKIDGISRTLSRVYIKKLFRKYDKMNLDDLHEFSENNSRRWGGGLESI
tara:strand:+ start:1690 stop:3795 length:2106 start_codon:yes stop_codon:yes gene_type:complete